MKSNDSNLVFPFDVALHYCHDIDPKLAALLTRISFVPLLVSCVFLCHRQARVVGSGWLLYAKLIFATALCYVERLSSSVVDGAVLDYDLPDLPDYLSTAITALPSVIAIGLVLIVKIEHHHTLKSSARLALWLTTSFLLDVQRLYRHLFRQPEPHSAVRFLPAILGLKLTLILLEELPKLPIASKPTNSLPNRRVNATSSAGFWTRACFICLNPTIPSWYGDKAAIILSAQHLEAAIAARIVTGKGPSLSWFLRVLCKPIAGFTIALCTSRLFFTACKLSQVTIIIKVIIFMQNRDYSLEMRIGLLVAACFAYFGHAFSRCLFKGLCDNLTVQVRGILVPTIHKKLFVVTDSQRRQIELENMLDSNLEGLVAGIANIVDSVAVTVEVVVSIKWLVDLVGYPILLILVVPSVYGFAVRYLKRGLPESQRAVETATSRRVKATSSLISQIKAIRLCRLTSNFYKKIERLRLTEIGKLTEIFYSKQVLASTNSVIWIFPGPVTFSILAVILKGHSPTALLFFPLVAILAIFVTAAMDVVRNVNKTKTLTECAARIQNFLLLGDATVTTTTSEPVGDKPYSRLVKDDNGLDGSKSEGVNSDKAASKNQPLALPNGHAVNAVQASLTADGWSSAPLLQDVTLHIKRYELAMVAGPTGCGKSTFLHAILGQASVVDGDFQKSVGLAGYCSQIPWLQHVSIRDNIIGYKPMDPDWYNTVVRACLLDRDFAQLSSGDLSKIGNHGLNLSRGQRCRIALARALYLRASCLVLDNVFAGLDEQSRTDLFNRIFGRSGIWHQQLSTVIMTTNSRELLKRADRTILIDSAGHVTMHTDHGAEYRRRLQSLGLPDDNDVSTNYRDEAVNAPISDINPFEISMSKAKASNMSTCYTWISCLDWESVKRQLTYLAISWVCLGCADIFVCVWLSIAPASYLFLSGYWAISALAFSVTVTLFRMWYLEFAPLSALDIHQRLLDTITGANLSFVTQFSYSSMLNLFDSELKLVSELLPIYFIRVTHQGGVLVVQLCLIAALARYSAVFLVTYISGFCITLFWYLQISGPVQIANMKAKAAMQANLAELTAGLRHFKAFGWQQQALDQSNEVLAQSQDCFYHARSIIRWMYLAVEAARSLASVLTICIVLFTDKPIPVLAVGLILVLPMKAEDSPPLWIDDFTTFTNSLQTLGALLQFLEKAPLETRGASKDCDLDSNWPHNGNIVFRNVTAKYNEKSSAPAALKNASFNITAGHKIGVVGKSGSGKSSVLMALLNFLDYEGDIEIDGRNLSDLSHRQLREHINIISQDRIDLGGTVEHNLFPKGNTSVTGKGVNPQVIELVLESLGLDDVLLAPAKGLRADVSSLNLSDGQHRLISVARGMFEALLGGSNLVVIDDMTGNLDPATETRVLNALMDAFNNHTVIMEVSHADQVKKCDYTLHMDDGEVKEFRHNPNGPEATKADQDKNRQLNLTRAQEAQAEVNATLPPGTRMQNSEIGPVPVAKAYENMMDVIAGVPGASIEPPHQEEIAALLAGRAALVQAAATLAAGFTTTVASGSGSQTQATVASGSGSQTQATVASGSGSQVQTAVASGSGSQVRTAEASGSGSQVRTAEASGSPVQAAAAKDPKGKGKAKEVLESDSDATEVPEHDFQATEPLDTKGKGKAKEVLDPKGKGKAKEIL